MPSLPLMPRSKVALRAALIAAALLSLTGCDIPGMGPDPRVVQREAEAKAIGGACRYALRGLEDCFTLNPKAPKALIFAGWKEMDQYMRDNKLEGSPSVLTQLDKKPAPPATNADDDIETESRPTTSRNRS